MAKTQFEKRKARTADAVSQEIQDKRAGMRASRDAVSAAAPAPIAEPVYNQQGFDIFTRDGGKTYEVAEISYNAETLQAEVVNIFTISRLVALSYRNQKTALQTLKKGK